MRRRPKIHTARSKLDGIIFYSNQIPAMGVFSKLNPDGSIKTQHVVTPIEEVNDLIGGGPIRGYYVSRRTTVLLDLILIILAVVTFKSYLIAGALYFSIFASRNFYQTVSYFFGMKLGGLKSLARFHGAEHMAVNAYNRYRRVPSVEEVYRFSRLSKRCGSRRILESAFFYTIISIEITLIGFINPVTFFLVLAATIAILYFLEEKDGLVFLQGLVTSKPNDIEIRVAIAGLKEFEKLEDSIDSDFTCEIFFVHCDFN